VTEIPETDWDYRRALAELWSRSSYERGLVSDPFGDPQRARQGLMRIDRLLAELGNPQLQVATVHVAGSKGKGSTSAFMSSMATHAGHRVGLYTSPHLHRFPERIAINGVPLSDRQFAVEAEIVRRAASRLEQSQPELGRVTAFEFVTAMAFDTFARLGCDLAVIEVGLGGRYDATNVLDPIVSVITRIDLEHTAVLGSNYADIAYQKVGILRPGVTCVSSPQLAEADATIVAAASEIGAPLHVGGRDWSWRGTWRSFAASGPWGSWPHLSLGVPGTHQVENACTALAARQIVDQSGIPISELAAREGLAAVRWPGRFEIVRDFDRVIVLDGAHTPAAAAAIAATWRDDFGWPDATVIFGTGADKDARGILMALRPIANRIIVTRAASPRAADPTALALSAMELRVPIDIQPTVASAINFALDSSASPLLITGSLFVAGEGREALGRAQPDLAWIALNSSTSSAALP
jgi:dihydrofolate synthase / folylpolyglutamate synthase